MTRTQGALAAVSVVPRAALGSFARAVLHALDEPVAVFWPDGRLLDPNPRFREMLSRLEAGPPSRDDPVLALGPGWAAALRECGAQGRPADWAGPGGLGGTLIPLRTAAGRTILVVGVMRAAGRRDDVGAFARLAAGAAHEIRNPLTAMGGLLQLLGPLVPAEPGAGYTTRASK